MMSLVNVSTAEGGVFHQLSLARHFRDKGATVKLVLPARMADATAAQLRDGYVEWSTSVVTAGLPPSFDSLLQLIPLLRSRIVEKYDVLYIRANLFTVVPVVLARLLGMKVMVEHNGWMSTERIARGGNPLIARLEQWMQVWSAAAANLNRCVTNGLKSLLISGGIDESTITVIGNGTDTELFYPINRLDVLSTTRTDPIPIRIGFIGGLVKWQGLETALHAYARLDNRKGTRLVIAGNGPEFDRLIKLANQLGIADQTDFLGHVSRDRANEVINTFDIAIAPFTAERNMEIGLSPIKIRDYAAAGRFVVCSDIPEILDVRIADWIRFHKPDDPDDLCRVLEMALRERPFQDDRTGEAARAYALANLDWSVICNRILKLIDGL